MNAKNIIILIANVILIAASIIILYINAIYMERGFDIRTFAMILLVLVGVRNVYQVMKKAKPESEKAHD
ncbi:hypothetical protein [Halobacillus mangrovi]|uniref:Uncharacterized protein n=1 Tax=Halobacillus mangrovi TaxID=402384 RepID=A0A1W5ZWS3_9BACI|nr:hypothetical protein [Halobacillus mangrovi]ARI77786.1 hypothetical protein HM131_13420 [Halobacillus mangrovi]